MKLQIWFLLALKTNHELALAFQNLVSDATVVTSIFYIQFMLTTNHSDWFQIFLCSKARVKEKSTPAAADSHQSQEM